MKKFILLFLLFIIIVIILVIGGAMKRKCGDGVCQIGEKTRCPEDCQLASDNMFTLKSGDYDFTIQHNGTQRRYLVHAPASYDKSKPTPVVMVFHGGGSNPEGIMKQSQMNKKSDSAGFIAVYPAGTGPKLLGKTVGTWNAGRCCGYAKDNKIDDVGFVEAVLDDLGTKFNIDNKRIYSTGHSNGALFSYRLACELSDRIAAIAPNSAQDSLDNCMPSRKVSVMHFHGTADPSAFYNGGHCGGRTKDEGWDCSSVEDYIKKWSQINGCENRTKVIYQNGNATCISYEGCDEGSEVILCSITGAGHTWPGGQELFDTSAWREMVGAISYDISANDMMWEFFKRHSLK